VQDGGTAAAGEYTLFYRKENENHELGTGFFVHKRIGSAVKGVEFVSDRMPYIILRGNWCHISVLNIHAPIVRNWKLPKYHMKILLGDSNAKVGRENIFKLTIGNESLHEISIMIMELG
jgi:hypothetical protein